MSAPDAYPFSVVFTADIPPIDLRFITHDVLHPSIAERKVVPSTDFSKAVTAQFLYGSPLLNPSSWRALMQSMAVMLGVMSNDHHMRLIEHMTGDGYLMGDVKTSPHKVYLLSINDGRWATWTNDSYFLDLETGERVEELPSPAVEHVAYNLTELVQREYRRCLCLPAIDP
jgi:hypothetical protein